MNNFQAGDRVHIGNTLATFIRYDKPGTAIVAVGLDTRIAATATMRKAD